MTQTLRNELELAAAQAEFLGPDDAGFIGLLPSSRPVVWPRTWIEGDRLCYGLPSDSNVHPAYGTTAGMLDRFWKIERAEQIPAFARKHGVLGFCTHLLPASHNPEPWPAPGPGKYEIKGCRPQRTEDVRELVFFDPVDRWLHYARLARALIAIAVALRGDKPGTREQWETVFEDHRETERWPQIQRECELLATSVDDSRFYLSFLVNEWLGTGGVRMAFRWPMQSETPELPTMAAGTFGLLGIQLAMTVADARLYQCNGCLRRYARTGPRPQAGRRNYCPDCGETARTRNSQRDLRELDRRILDRFDSGRSGRAIARDLRITTGRVHGAVNRRAARKKARPAGRARGR